MWCSHCQQDIPAVVRSAQGPLLCSQCEHEVVRQSGSTSQRTRPADTGISLDSFDEIQVAAEQELSPPINELEREQTCQRLKQIGRRLRSTYRHELELGNSPVFRDAAPQLLPPRVKATYQRPAGPSEQGSASWMISLLVFSGVAVFGLGLCLLAWSLAFQLPAQWQWGLTATIAAEGSLILGLSWMAVRLWRNSRRVNRQLDGVDRQLTEIQELAGSLVGHQVSSSQQYYSHFSQAASPHMLVANLRGQIDQLADRIAINR